MVSPSNTKSSRHEVPWNAMVPTFPKAWFVCCLILWPQLPQFLPINSLYYLNLPEWIWVCDIQVLHWAIQKLAVVWVWLMTGLVRMSQWSLSLRKLPSWRRYWITPPSLCVQYLFEWGANVLQRVVFTFWAQIPSLPQVRLVARGSVWRGRGPKWSENSRMWSSEIKAVEGMGLLSEWWKCSGTI